jgi:hypothetical protein
MLIFDATPHIYLAKVGKLHLIRLYAKILKELEEW